MKKFIPMEAAEQAICEVCERPGCPKLWGHCCNRIDRLDAIPAADVVEVVRCKDCAYCNQVAGFCEHLDTEMLIHDYCSDGYRRIGNG